MRGLSKELAMAGHDYFEVVFYHPDKTVRASWELMKEARITGVWGKGGEVPGGVNYSAFTTVGLSGAGNGAAILFVGKKVDRTLLAVGKLAQVNGVDGYTIDADTKTVTFDVAALKSGVGVADAGFFTDANAGTPGDANVASGNTITGNFTFAFPDPDEDKNKTFSMYKLRPSDITYAHYNIALEGSAIINNFGILLAGRGEYGRKQPRYPTPDGQFQYASVRLDDRTKITALNNNMPADTYFKSPLKVSFDTSAEPASPGPPATPERLATVTGSAFAFVFEIPIYALTAQEEPGTWYIRGSYDSYWLDLDAGPGSAGGAVLIGMGDPEVSSDDFVIRVVRPPNKWRYNKGTDTNLLPLDSDLLLPGNSINLGRDFNVDGLVVWLVNTATPNIAEKELNVYTDLTYELGMKRIIPNTGPGTRNGELIKDTLYSIQTIKVIYTEPGTGRTRTGSFYIICDNNDNLYRFTSIPANHYLRAWNGNSANAIISFIVTAGRGTYIVILIHDHDVVNFQMQIGQSPSLVIVVAGSDPVPYNENATIPDGPPDPSVNPNRIFGRTGNGSGFTVAATDSAFFFGKWPFYAPLRVTHSHSGGSPALLGTPIDYHFSRTIPSGSSVANVTYEYDTHAYVLNADGPVSQVTNAKPGNSGYPSTPPDATPHSDYDKFIKTNIGDNSPGGVTSRLYNVTVDDYIKLVPIGTRQLY